MAARTTSRRGTDNAYPFHVRAVGPNEDLFSEVGPHLAEILQVIECASPGTLADLRTSGAIATLRTHARALDSSITHTNNTQREHPLDPFVTQVIEATNRDLDLVRASSTAPRGRDDRASVMAASHEWLARIRADGAAAGAWLVRDRRHRKGDTDHHVYGLLAIERSSREAIRDAWLALSGARRGSVDLVTMSGWKQYAATADATSLRTHLRKVTSYALHDLPPGEVRDLAVDVASCGPLGDAWSAFQRVSATLGAPHRLERLQPMGIIRSTLCAVCGASLLGKREDATYCSTPCRMKARKRSSTKGSTR